MKRFDSDCRSRPMASSSALQAFANARMQAVVTACGITDSGSGFRHEQHP